MEVAPESADDVHERGASRNPDTEEEGAQCVDKYATSSAIHTEIQIQEQEKAQCVDENAPKLKQAESCSSKTQQQW